MGIALLTAPLTLTGYPRTLAEMSVYAVDMIDRNKERKTYSFPVCVKQQPQKIDAG